MRGQQTCSLFYINNVNSKLGCCNTKAPLVAALVHSRAYCTHSTHDVNDVMCEGWPHHRGLCPLHFLNSECKCGETGPTVFPVKLKDKFNLTSKHHFPRNKNQQYYSRFDHSINQTRKQLWFIAKRRKETTIQQKLIPVYDQKLPNRKRKRNYTHL